MNFKLLKVLEYDMSLTKGLVASSIAGILVLGLFSSISIAQRPPVGGSTAGPTSTDQGGGRPAPLINNDWRLVQFGQSIIRYNSMNGTTQMMSMDNQGKMTWRNFDEHSGALNRGNAGRYEVMAGPSAIGGVVRVDTQSGETWGTNKPANLITAGDLTGGGLKASDLVAGKFGFYKVTFN